MPPAAIVFSKQGGQEFKEGFLLEVRNPEIFRLPDLLDSL
jgi:hypothetical protein